MPPANREIRWVVTDIDGTITDRKGRLDVDAIRLLRELEDRGIPVGLVSGRPFPMVLMLGEYIGLSGPLIAENGGAIRFRGANQELGSRAIATEAARQLGSLLPIQMTWDDGWRVSDCAIEPSVAVDDVLGALQELHLDVEVQVSSIMIHLAKRGVTKRSAMERWLTTAGESSDAVLIAGDSGSDAGLFRAFASSIAPSNSTAPILQLASYRASAGYAAGFCEGLEHFRELGILP